MNKIIKYALMNAFGTALYVVIVVLFINLMQWKFGGEKDTIFIPMAMLMLLVFSVALVGVLMFGKPVMWYIDGKKKEALSLLAHTLGIFLLITLFAVGLMIGEGW